MKPRWIAALLVVLPLIAPAKEWTIANLAGTATKGEGPEGKATNCALNRPHGIFVDADGTML